MGGGELFVGVVSLVLEDAAEIEARLCWSMFICNGCCKITAALGGEATLPELNENALLLSPWKIDWGCVDGSSGAKSRSTSESSCCLEDMASANFSPRTCVGRGLVGIFRLWRVETEPERCLRVCASLQSLTTLMSFLTMFYVSNFS